MGKSAFARHKKMNYASSVHEALQRKRLKDAEEKVLTELKKDIMNDVQREAENFVSDDVFAGQKGLLLLSLRKKGWGRERGLWLLDDLDETEKAFRKPEPGKPDNSISWPEVFDAVKEEYGIDLRERYGIQFVEDL